MYIEGRRICFAKGAVTQTVNICTGSNRRGEYEVSYRLSGPERFVGVADLDSVRTLEKLRQRLLDRGAREERHSVGATPLGDTATTPAAGGVPPPDPLTPGPAMPGSVAPARPTIGAHATAGHSSFVDQEWLANANRTTELAIDSLLWEFVEHPYMHRVEHSLHARLFDILVANPLFAHRLPIGGSGYSTQPVHKEWPETVPRPEKEGRRGNFDLAILGPAPLAAATVDEFTVGLVPPWIVIEVGLNYSLEHLANDHWKLVNSHVESGFLVHFSRNRQRDLRVEEYLLDPQRQYRTAYAHHEPDGWCTFKTLNGPLQRVPRGRPEPRAPC